MGGLAPGLEAFAAVIEEIGQLLALGLAYMGRFEPESVLTTVARSVAPSLRRCSDSPADGQLRYR
jgi:hypothetical protein